jgi:hypothetical protein
MFDLQAQRFALGLGEEDREEGEEAVSYEVLD